MSGLGILPVVVLGNGSVTGLVTGSGIRTVVVLGIGSVTGLVTGSRIVSVPGVLTFESVESV